MAGLIVRDKNSGRVMIDATTVLGNILGVVETGGAGSASSGSISNPLIGVGTPFLFINRGPISFTREDVNPTFWFEGNQLKWSYPSPSNQYDYQRPRCIVSYGVMPGYGEVPTPAGQPKMVIRSPIDGRIQFFTGGISSLLVQKGVAYTTTDPSYRAGNTGPSSVMIPVNADNKNLIVAVRAEFTVAMYGTRYNNSTGIYNFLLSCDTIENGQPVEYWVFELASKIGATGVGLKLRNINTNELTYNSNYDALKIAGIISGDLYESTSFTPGKKYAAILPTMAGHNEISYGSLYIDGQLFLESGDGFYDGTIHHFQRQNDGKLYGVRWQNETITTGMVSFDDVIVEAPGYAYRPDPVGVWWSNPLTNVIVIDVTAM